MAVRSLCLHLFYAAVAVHAVTVYNQLGPLAAQSTNTTAISTSAALTSTGNFIGLAAAYNPTTWPPPALPDPLPASQFAIELMPTADLVEGISIPAPGSFFGLSIEMSVVTQVLGINASSLHVPFLNLMALITDRVGQVVVRVGVNTQDYATLVVTSTSDGKTVEKHSADSTNPARIPTLLFTDELLYSMANISKLVNAKWFLDVPFVDSINISMEIVEHSERIIGSNVLGYQVGNKPDLYAKFLHRNVTYGAQDFHQEFGTWRDAFNNNALVTAKKTMIGPSLSLWNTTHWSLEDTWDTGFLPNYVDNLYALSVERYPSDNCNYFNGGTVVYLPDALPDYLAHSAGIRLVQDLLNSTLIAQQYSLPFIMFEANSASCGGFAGGVSNVYGIALWALDYGLQMVYSNLTHALIHMGGQDAFYNPFTPPPTNQAPHHQWTIGPIFYSILAMTEVLGNTSTSRVVDLFPNNGDEHTPAYAIYENDQLARVALFNYMDDPTGTAALSVTISVGGKGADQPLSTPAQVKVKYLSAPSVNEKFNITWAGRTFGGQFESDGRLVGEEQIMTIFCDTKAGACTIPVPAPGFALVFITESAVQNSAAQATATFPTAAQIKAVSSVSVDPVTLKTSNGHSGKTRILASTSRGGAGDAERTVGAMSWLAAASAILASALVAFRVLFS